MRAIQEISFQTRAAWKRLISFFKTDWTIDDYPINLGFQNVSESSPPSRNKALPWTATVINWPGIAGCGNTRLEAIEELRKHFELRKSTNKKLPRPGTNVPIEFAESRRVDRHAELAKDFTKRVLGIEWA